MNPRATEPLPVAEEAVVPSVRSIPPASRTPVPPNGGGGQIDPAVLLLVEEVRRSNDALRSEVAGAVKTLAAEVRELRRQAPGRLSVYALSSVVVLALVALLALVATRGVDPVRVAEAVGTVAPTATP